MRAEHREGEQPDGAGAENGDGPAGHVAGHAHGVHRGRQRLDDRRGGIVERVRHRMQAVGGQGEVVRHAALSVAAAEELQVFAQVLTSGGAHLARPAGQVGLHDDPLSCRVALDGGASGFDDPDNLVARPVGQRDKRVAPLGRVQVGSADAGRQGADQGLVRARGGDVRCLDGDPARVDDDASHASQGNRLR